MGGALMCGIDTQKASNSCACSTEKAPHTGGLVDSVARVVANDWLNDSLGILTLDCPFVAQNILPGQFVHMTIPTLPDRILRRPFSIYDANPATGAIEILYQVVGVGTAEMRRWEAEQPPLEVHMIGCIGNPWGAPEHTKRALLVGGGVGAAPLLLLYKHLLSLGVSVDVILGASTKNMLVCRERYERVGGLAPACTTDDGSYGTEGFATVLVHEACQQQTYDYAAICGPEPFMKAASAITLEANIPTQVSLEKRMACGIGACLSCVVEATSGKMRSCVDGPIFDAKDIVW